MAANSFSVQIADLAGAASQFTKEGDTLGQEVAHQAAALDSLGNFWGTQAHGPEFGGTYQPLADRVLAAAKAAGIALQGVGAGLQQMGKLYNITEDQIQATLNAISAKLPGR